VNRVGPIRTGGIRPARVAALTIVACVAVPAAAPAAEVTRVVSGFDDARRFDFNITLTFLHDQKQAIIKRELESSASTSQAQLTKDLVYHQSRDVLNARIEMGVFRDVGLHVDLPYVIRDDRQLDFDQSEGGRCIFSGGAALSNCVDSDNSSLLRDGILPGAGQTTFGVNASPGGNQFSRPSSTVFQGPRRNGLESLGLGVSWAIMNQARDDTRPTLILGVDAKLDLGSTMRYDAADPGANTSVGLGYHQVVATTSVSKRLGALDPFFSVYYILPVPGGGSPFKKYALDNRPYAAPQSRVGAQFGFEFIPWERPDGNQRVTFEARMRADHRFQGTSYSELWEPLSGSSSCGSNGAAACRAGIDLDLDADGVPNSPDGVPDHPHPGVTETQAYSTFGGDIGLNIQANKYTRFRGLLGVSSDLPHFITFGTAGSDRNGDGRVDSVDPNEANPVYRESIDIPGRRFKVDGTRIWNVAIELAVVF
jgi:hypothetical protein